MTLYSIFHVSGGELYKYVNKNYLELMHIVYDYFYEMAKDKAEAEFEDYEFTNEYGDELEWADLTESVQRKRLIQYMLLNLDDLFFDIFNIQRHTEWYVYKQQDNYLSLVDERNFRMMIYSQLKQEEQND